MDRRCADSVPGIARRTSSSLDAQAASGRFRTRRLTRRAAALPGSPRLIAGALAPPHDPNRHRRPFLRRHDTALPFDPAALPVNLPLMPAPRSLCIVDRLPRFRPDILALLYRP
jgi:hypothetical protein